MIKQECNSKADANEANAWRLWTFFPLINKTVQAHGWTRFWFWFWPKFGSGLDLVPALVLSRFSLGRVCFPQTQTQTQTHAEVSCNFPERQLNENGRAERGESRDQRRYCLAFDRKSARDVYPRFPSGLHRTKR